MSLLCCGLFCGGFSIFCGIALIVTAWVVSNQSPLILIEEKTPAQVVHNCLVGASLYGGCLLASILCVFTAKQRQRHRYALETPSPRSTSETAPLLSPSTQLRRRAGYSTL